MQAKTLFSQHYLKSRLPDDPEWQEDPQKVFDNMRALWIKACQYGDNWNEAQTEEEFVKPILQVLGWSYVVEPKATHRGRVTRPDYALFPDEATKDTAMPYQGKDDAFYSRALAIAEAKHWELPLANKIAAEKRLGRRIVIPVTRWSVTWWERGRLGVS